MKGPHYCLCFYGRDLINNMIMIITIFPIVFPMNIIVHTHVPACYVQPVPSTCVHVERKKTFPPT